VPQTTPNPIRAQILLIADELRQSGGPIYVARIRTLLKERLGAEVNHGTISADLRRHGYELPGRGRPRLRPLPGFSVAV